ncbi:MAG: peptidoglycan-associated lipoprotein Pal, partial [Deltaproteobacteria bacterium]|nr:peptidoglycan-associated lipoprotein Pal [Deltaproteobacteria bacterium]
MTKRFWIGLALLLVIPGLIFTVSCAKKQVKSEPGVTGTEDAGAKRLEGDAQARALEEERLQEQRAETAARQKFQNEDIHFEFDKSGLLPEAKRILRDKAKWMMADPNASVIIEGHCDERGTNEYNMALGDRRAASAKSFLVNIGIASQRLTTISYGEEKPLDPASNNEAWDKNRRAHF